MRPIGAMGVRTKKLLPVIQLVHIKTSLVTEETANSALLKAEHVHMDSGMTDSWVPSMRCCTKRMEATAWELADVGNHNGQRGRLEEQYTKPGWHNGFKTEGKALQ